MTSEQANSPVPMCPCGKGCPRIRRSAHMATASYEITEDGVTTGDTRRVQGGPNAFLEFHACAVIDGTPWSDWPAEP